jgi:hypothetical protein
MAPSETSHGRELRRGCLRIHHIGGARVPSDSSPYGLL